MSHRQRDRVTIPPFLNFTFLFLSLHEGRRLGVRRRKTKTVFHMVLLKSSLAGTQYLQPTAMQQQQVCMSVWDGNKETKGDREGCNTPNGNDIKCEG